MGASPLAGWGRSSIVALTWDADVEGLFLGGSLLAAFLAGSIALFAPCCILVVFPAYLAAAVRNRRWRLVPLTLVFAAGLALVLVPITLGVGLLSRALLRYHGPIYLLGGVLLLALAVLALSGRTWSLPFLRGSPDISRTDSGGVFALGVFSGAASACCAPVLAGVLTLTAIAPTSVEAAGIGLAYVFGMVAPLIVLTLLWDRSTLRERLAGSRRRVRLRLAGLTISSTLPELAAAAMFAVMGVVMLVLGATGATIAPTFQAGIGSWLEDLLRPVVRWLEPVPDWITGAVLVAFGAGALLLSARARPVPATDPSDIELERPGTEDAHEHACSPQA